MKRTWTRRKNAILMKPEYAGLNKLAVWLYRRQIAGFREGHLAQARYSN